MIEPDPQADVPYFVGRGLTDKPLRDAALREADRLMPLWAEDASAQWYIHSDGRHARDLSRLLRRLVWECERLSELHQEALQQRTEDRYASDRYLEQVGLPSWSERTDTTDKPGPRPRVNLVPVPPLERFLNDRFGDA